MNDAKEAAKLIRTDLKNAFTGVKFSVTSDNYSGGNAVRVDYEFGPLTKDVTALVKKYQDGDFDGMTDSYNYRKDKPGHVCAKYVQVQRSFSNEAIIMFAQAICQYDGKTYENENTEVNNRYANILAHRVLASLSFTSNIVTFESVEAIVKNHANLIQFNITNA